MLRKKQIYLPIILVVVSGCTHFPRVYLGAEEIHGWAVDSKTKEPIENVIVLAIWELEGGLHVDHTANIMIMETVTNNKGYYFFESWGPRFTMQGRMDELSPKLVFYKFGYDDKYLFNHQRFPVVDYDVSRHTGKNIELEIFNGQPKEYERRTRGVDEHLGAYKNRSALQCTWTEIPRFTVEMLKLGEYFSSNYVASGFGTINNLNASGCGDAEEILGKYLND